MKVPKPQKMSSGSYFIRLRFKGEEPIYITRKTEKECIRAAELAKAEHRNGWVEERTAKKPECMTLTKAIGEYISLKEMVLSPLTIRGYDRIGKNRFQSIMQTSIDTLAEYTKDEWQKIVNAEAAKVKPKTLRNSFAFIKTVIEYFTKKSVNAPTLPQEAAHDTAFLQPEEIPIFVKDCVGRPQSVSLLLALSSLRISEIMGLRWEDIPKGADFVRVKQAEVRNKDNEWVLKQTTKNKTSTRNVPILIPELKQEIERCRKPSGRVLTCSQNNLRLCLDRICQRTGITRVTPHGLRHSFASLCYHLQVPEKICQEIGGWKDSTTMHKIYTHVAQSDIKRYQNEIADFFNNQNGN